MDEAQIRALLTSVLTPMLAGIKTEFTSYVDTAIGSVRAEIPELPQTEAGEKTGDESPALLATQKELADLKKELESQALKEGNARLENQILTYASSKGVTAPGLLVDAVQRRFKDQLTEDNKEWFFKDGTRLDSKLDEFLATAEGKALLPPSGTAGSGSQETPVKGTTSADPDPWAQLASIYKAEA